MPPSCNNIGKTVASQLASEVRSEPAHRLSAYWARHDTAAPGASRAGVRRAQPWLARGCGSFALLVNRGACHGSGFGVARGEPAAVAAACCLGNATQGAIRRSPGVALFGSRTDSGHRWIALAYYPVPPVSPNLRCSARREAVGCSARERGDREPISSSPSDADERLSLARREAPKRITTVLQSLKTERLSSAACALRWRVWGILSRQNQVKQGT